MSYPVPMPRKKSRHGRSIQENEPADWVPINPRTASLQTLLHYANQYRNDEPRLAKVMLELLSRDLSEHKREVEGLRLRWAYLVRSTQPVKWPDTAIAKKDRAFDGRCFQAGENGMLSFFGYHVGVTQGLVMAVRHEILDYIYRGNLPLVCDEDYTKSWGEPASSKRLKKLSGTLARLAWNAMAKEAQDYETAISEWAADLRYLKSMYFRPYANPEHAWDWPAVDA
jgi:hypothetical protein